MIALVSDQRMQNVIPILQAGNHYDELVLVLSKDRRTGEPLPRYRHSADDLKAVLSQRLYVSIHPEWVDPYNIEAVAGVIEALAQKDTGDGVVVNISGGTKPMAVGALRGAQCARAACLYTNTEDGEILWLFPDGSTSSEPIQVKDVDVPLYIRAYGENVSASKRVADVDAIHQAWARMMGDNHKVIYKVVNRVTAEIKTAYRDKSGFPIICPLKPTRRQREIVERLAQQGLWKWDPDSSQITVVNQAAASFLHGDWVEVYVAMRMQHSGLYDDVRLNLELEGVAGEIDVAAVSNAKLVLIECKSNVQRSEQLNKLDAFRRRLGGPYAHAYYARASEAYARQIQDQCKKLRLDGVFFGAQLSGLGDEIGKRIGASTERE